MLPHTQSSFFLLGLQKQQSHSIVDITHTRCAKASMPLAVLTHHYFMKIPSLQPPLYQLVVSPSLRKAPPFDPLLPPAFAVCYMQWSSSCICEEWVEMPLVNHLRHSGFISSNAFGVDLCHFLVESLEHGFLIVRTKLAKREHSKKGYANHFINFLVKDNGVNCVE